MRKTGSERARPAAEDGGRALRQRREAVITISELGEFGLIEAITELVRDRVGQAAADDRRTALILGIGDDAAVIRAPDSRVVATTDMLIEGRHFRRDWSSAADVGAKAAARNLADVAAMGARPTALLVSFAAPGDLPAKWALDLIAGLADECAAVGAGLAGGDVSSAEQIMLSVTALGDLAGLPPVTRSGARPGDVVALAGTLGAAAAGMDLLTAGLAARADSDPRLAGLVAAHRRPRPPYDAGPHAAASGATSMIDISDGLVADLGHVAAASGARIELRSGPLSTEPVSDPGALRAAADLLGRPVSLRWVLTGGDDHALAATFPPDASIPSPFTVVGTVTEGAGVLIDGQSWSGPAGWEHFRSGANHSP